VRADIHSRHRGARSIDAIEPRREIEARRVHAPSSSRLDRRHCERRVSREQHPRERLPDIAESE
jgi:hypothetical protein